MSRKRRKRKRSKPVEVNDPWEKSNLRIIGKRVQGNEFECFECFVCGEEFREARCIPHHPCRRTDCCLCATSWCDDPACNSCAGRQAGVQCSDGSCPNCGSIYVNWLSYDTPWHSIYFRSEREGDSGAYDGTIEWEWA